MEFVVVKIGEKSKDIYIYTLITGFPEVMNIEDSCTVHNFQSQGFSTWVHTHDQPQLQTEDISKSWRFNDGTSDNDDFICARV